MYLYGWMVPKKNYMVDLIFLNFLNKLELVSMTYG